MVEINLLPAQYRKRSEPGLWRIGTIALPVATALAVLAFTVIQNTRLNNLQTRLDDTEGQISALEPDHSEFLGLNRQKSDLQKVTDVSSSLQASKTYWSTDLARFVNALPSAGGVALTALTVRSVDANSQTNLAQQGLYNGKAITKEFDLTGQAVSSQALVDFLKTFEDNPNFGVNFRSAQKVTPQTGTSPAAADKNPPYTFSAAVGMIGAPTAVAATTPAAGAPAGAAGSTPSTPGGSDVR